MKTSSLSVFALLLVCPVFAAEPAKEISGVTVSLKLSVESYDPSKPAGTITCVVRNQSEKEIVLPAEYGGETITLYCNGLRLWRRGFPAKGHEPATFTIAAGKVQQLFELPLAEILMPQRGIEERKWGWDWERRPAPPASPIHLWRKPGYAESARFHAELILPAGKVASEPVTMKLKDSGAAK